MLSDELSKALSVLGSRSSENYFGTLRSSLMSQRATLSRAREPDWWVAARGVGTYISRVLMPKPTCSRGENAVKKAGTTNSELTWLGMDNQIHTPPHSPIKTLKICIFKFSQVSILTAEEIQTKQINLKFSLIILYPRPATLPTESHQFPYTCTFVSVFIKKHTFML